MHTLLRYYAACLWACCYTVAAMAQTPTTTTAPANFPALPATLISAQYSLQQPAADLAQRFGINSAIGVGVFYKTTTNWLVGVEGNFFFGNRIYEDSILSNLSTREGYLLNQNGQYANVQLFERGYTTLLKVGKIIPIGKRNANSGLLLMLGGGAMQHKIRIEARDEYLPQLNGDYLKGYDRLTSGPAVSATLGYLFLDNKRLLNFYAGFETIYGFTRTRRSYYLDTQQSDHQLRHDLLMGVRIGWLLPLYGTVKGQERYYTN